MKKVLVVVMVALLLLVGVGPAFAGSGPGGLVGLFAGCCFGPRTAAAVNDGKSISLTEWLMLLGIGQIIAGIEGMGGNTTADLAKSYGSNYY